MAQSKIRWKRGDYIKLGKAVADFNRKITKLQAEENKLYLPNIIEYKEAKENILTRAELNRLVNSLRRFQRAGAEDLYVTEAGEELTKWERRELRNSKQNCTKCFKKRTKNFKYTFRKWLFKSSNGK